MWIAYHDVRWNLLDQVDRDLQMLHKAGIQTVALGIIPDVPEEHKEVFRQWLGNRKTQGYELLVHGWKHQCDWRYQCSISGRFQRWLTHDEAEFAGLNQEDSQHLLFNAVRASQSLGIDRFAFIPPTWHATRSLKGICLQAGFSIYESRFRLFYQGKSRWNLPISIAGLPSWMPFLILWISRLLGDRFASSYRYVLHPGELEKYPMWLNLLSSHPQTFRYTDFLRS